MKADSLDDLLAALKGREGDLVDCLSKTLMFTHTDYIFDFIWGHQGDGGPTHGNSRITHLVCETNCTIIPMGWEIVSAGKLREREYKLQQIADIRR